MTYWDGDGYHTFQDEEKPHPQRLCSIVPPSSYENMTVYCSKFKTFVESEDKTCGINNKTLCKDCEHAFIKAKKNLKTKKHPSRFDDVI